MSDQDLEAAWQKYRNARFASEELLNSGTLSSETERQIRRQMRDHKDTFIAGYRAAPTQSSPSLPSSLLQRITKVVCTEDITDYRVVVEICAIINSYRPPTTAKIATMAPRPQPPTIEKDGTHFCHTCGWGHVGPIPK